MTHEDIFRKVQELLREVFERDDLVIDDNTSAKDIPGWDSVLHIEIMLAVEQRFGITFRSSELDNIKNVGDIVKIVQSKVRS